MIEAGAHTLRGPLRATAMVVDLAALVLAAIAAGAAAYAFGRWSVVVLGYALMLIAAIFAPRALALFLISAMVVIEPTAIDISGELTPFLYGWPDGWLELLPLTMQPLEFFVLAIAISLALRPAPRIEGAPRIPLLYWAVPFAIAAGMAYGLYKGGPQNFAYHEARGLLYGILVLYRSWFLGHFARGNHAAAPVLGESAWRTAAGVRWPWRSTSHFWL